MELGLDRVCSGFILYNGEQEFRVHNVRILNPLHVEDLWETLVSP